MANETRVLYNRLLDNIARELDIPPSKYQVAVERYTAVGDWLESGEYDDGHGALHIYPQGSFRLGTVVRPIKEGKEADYDIDLVCTFQAAKESISSLGIKTAVGDRLKENGNYRKMLEREGIRCWTLDYAEEDGTGFHIDVLPSSLEDGSMISSLTASGVPYGLAAKAIAITHKEEDGSYSWSPSNPDGYAEWFDAIKKPSFEKVSVLQKSLLLQENRNIYSKVEDIPDQLVRTPLQRAIQILKRHRDIRFAGHELEMDKPISVIITTLAGRLYQQEADTFTTLNNIVTQLDAHAQLLQPGAVLGERVAGLKLISREPDGTWLILNPVNPGENFADYWHEHNHRKARAFFQWVAWIRADLIDILSQPDIKEIGKSLERQFGQSVISEASKDVYAAAASMLMPPRVEAVPHVNISNPSKPWGTHG